MAYRRSYRSRPRRRMRRPMRRMRRSIRVRRPISSTKVNYFKRSFNTTLTVPDLSSHFNAWLFSLDSLPNYTEFTNLYQQYKLIAVKFTVNPRFNNIDMATPAVGQLYSWISHADMTNPGSIDGVTEKSTAKKTPLTRIHKRYFKLSTLSAAYDGSGVGVNEITYNRWLFCGDTSVQHYGLCTFAPANNTGADLIYDVQATIYFACKQLK